MTDAVDRTTRNDVSSLESRYAVRGLLGSGGMGEVFEAHDRTLARTVAIKLFSRDRTPHIDLRREREVRILSRLQHPNLVEIHDVGVTPGDDSRFFVVMEHMERGSLLATLAGGPLSWHEAAEVGEQVADALAYLHENGLAHRDVKPANILLSDRHAFGYSVLVKLGDFDVSQYLGEEPLTEHGAIVGSASYLSPEQVLSEPVAASSDVYSLGLVLLESLTGTREFDGSVADAALARLDRDPVIPDTLPAAWRRTLAAMTARDASQRPTALAVAAALHAMRETPCEQLDAPDELEGPRHRADRTSGPRGATRILAALGAVGIASIVTVAGES